MASRELRIGIEIARNYGVHSIKFSMNEVVRVKSGTERREAYNNLLAQLEDQLADYEAHHLQHTKLPSLSGDGVEIAGKLEKFKASYIMVESRNGRREVSVQGGKYSKHGVPVYPDSCITDLPIEEYEYGKHSIIELDLTATVDIVDGKAKRALSIR